MKSKKTTLVVMFSFIVITLLSASFASAEFWACFERGQIINFCNPEIPDRTASTDNYRLCMDTFDSTNKCYTLGNWNVCNGLAGNGCGGGNGDGGTLDTNAPMITVNSPINGSVYSSRKIELSVALSETGKIEYENLISGRGRCSVFCKGCSSSTKSLSFKEGENRYQIKATDNNGNSAFKDIIFFVDSQKPRVHSVEPKKGFADGTFSIIYTEDNLKNITLSYGNAEHGYKEVGLNMSQCMSGKKESCDIKVDLSAYEGETIEYMFMVEDIAKNQVSSRIVFLDVDSSFPEITSLDYTIDGNKVSFVIGVNEPNLQVINYVDNYDSRGREKRMCSKLIDGQCKFSGTFSSGDHELAISALDKAGNLLTQNVRFSVA